MKRILTPTHTKLVRLTDGTTKIKLITNSGKEIEPVILTTKVSLKPNEEQFVGSITDQEVTVKIDVELRERIDRVKSSSVTLVPTQDTSKEVGSLKKLQILSQE
jgi:hypothetical protein